MLKRAEGPNARRVRRDGNDHSRLLLLLLLLFLLFLLLLDRLLGVGLLCNRSSSQMQVILRSMFSTASPGVPTLKKLAIGRKTKYAIDPKIAVNRARNQKMLSRKYPYLRT